MPISLKEYIEMKKPISESITGKAYAVAQNRSHASNRSRLESILSRIQNNAKKGYSQSEHEKREEIVFQLFHDLASALKLLADMDRNTMNVSTAGVLDTENIRSELKRSFPKHFQR